MKPVKLTMRAFGPFVDETTVDFERLDRHGPFLIQGATGSGKSTIFEAMTYALFGDAGKNRERGSQDLVSTLRPDQVAPSNADRSFVEFTFTADGRTFTVKRYPAQRVARTRARGGNVDPVEAKAEASLLIASTDGTEAVEDPRRVNEAIAAAIGCDVAQFRQTILLPQGEFRKVVTDPDARQTTLKRIFRTERYERVGKALGGLHSEAKGQLDQAIERRDAWLRHLGAESVDDVAGKLAAVEAEATAAERRRHEADAQRSLRTQALQGATTLMERFAERDRWQGVLARFAAEAPAHEARVARLQAAERAQGLEVHLERRDAAARTRAQEHAALPGLEERLGAAARAWEGAVAALAAERARDEERAALTAEAARLAALQPRVEEVARERAAAARDEGELARLTAARAGLEATLATIATREQALGSERAALEPLALGLDLARTRAAEALAVRDDLVRLADFDAAAADLDAQVRALEAALADAVGHATLLDALRHHAPGIVADTLQAGEPCPACGSREHPAPHAEFDRRALEAALTSIQERAAERARLLDRGERARADAANLRAQRAADLAITPDVASAEAALTQANDTAAAAKRAAERSRAIDADLERLRREGDAVNAERSRVAEAASALAATIAARADRVAAIEADLPADARDAAAFGAHLASVRSRAEERHRALEAAVANERARTSERDAAAERLADARSRAQAADVERDAQALAFTAALASEGFGDEAAFQAARASASAIAALRRDIDQTLRDRDAAERQVQALEGALAGRSVPDLERLRADLAEAEAAWRTADEGYVKWAQRRDQARTGGAEIERLVPEVKRLTERFAAAERLFQSATGKVKGAAKLSLEAYALEILFEAVLEQSNHHLLRMTRQLGGHGAGPYTLHLPVERSGGDRSLDLEVIDHGSNGIRRPAKTLSGGEGFMAALALAFGLAEATARERYPIDALFIDEGFGTLDQASLGKVIEALRNLPQLANRMVGVISHVEELKRLIPVHLLVERADDGASRLKVAVNA